MAEIAGELGMDVAILDLHQSTCDHAAATFRRNLPAVRVVGIAADVTKPESLDAAVAHVLAAFPGRRIGAVFANAVRIAGIGMPCLLVACHLHLRLREGRWGGSLTSWHPSWLP